VSTTEGEAVNCVISKTRRRSVGWHDDVEDNVLLSSACTREKR
jgi:hypothetical protein